MKTLIEILRSILKAIQTRNSIEKENLAIQKEILTLSNVPCYFLAPIFAEILAQVNNIAQSELFESDLY